MSTWMWILIGVAIGACLPLVGLLASRVGDAFRDRAHRLRVARAVAEGWNEPRVAANWALTNSDDVYYDGISAVTAATDRGIGVREYTRHARTVQRRVEEAWLAGIETEKRRERAAESAAQPA